MEFIFTFECHDENRIPFIILSLIRVQIPPQPPLTLEEDPVAIFSVICNNWEKNKNTILHFISSFKSERSGGDLWQALKGLSHSTQV